LDRLDESPEIEAYAGALGDRRADAFTAAIDELRQHREDLRQSLVDRRHYSEWEALSVQLSGLHSDFSDLPGAQPTKSTVAVLIGKKLAALELPLDVEPDLIDPSKFSFRKLSSPLPIAWFSHTNSNSFDDSLVVISPSDLQRLQKELSEDESAGDL